MNITRRAKGLIDSYNKSDKSHTAIAGQKQTIHCYDKFLGHYTIQAYPVIGKKNNFTGKITNF